MFASDVHLAYKVIKATFPGVATSAQGVCLRLLLHARVSSNHGGR